MQPYLSRAQLKDQAKNTLAGHYGLLIGSSLLVVLITLFINQIVAVLFPTMTSFAGILISMAVSFLVSVFVNIFNVGISLMYLKYACGNRAVLFDLFYGFKNHLENALAVSLVLTAINSFPSIVCEIPYRLYLTSANIMYLYVFLLLGVLTLAVCVPLNLVFSQCFFIMLDFPDKSAGEVLSLSARIMKGNKLRLFILELSFLPILLLGIVSCVGYLWVIPYMKMAFAHFYFDIMRPGR